jgi:cell wall-associated NlpC family hydrolase
MKNKHIVVIIFLLLQIGIPSCAARYASKNPNSEITPPDTAGTGIEDYTDEDVAPEEEATYSIESVFQSPQMPNTVNANFGNAVENIKMAIIKYYKTPYVWGGTSLSGVDCSGFTLCVYVEAFSKKLPRTAREQFTVGDHIPRGNLKFGDLIFFDTRRRVRPGHVGIYLWGNVFVHSSSRRGVIFSSLTENYYDRKFMGGRRMLEFDN